MYLFNREYHTDTSEEYMTSLGIDAETRESILRQQEFEYDKACKSVRSKRNRLLAETDYYTLPDAPTAPQGLTEYRQALRDITEQSGFPHDVVLPEI